MMRQLLCVAFVLALAGPAFGQGLVQCQDCVDNDGDGLIDMEDTDCIHPLDQQEYPTVGCGLLGIEPFAVLALRRRRR